MEKKRWVIGLKIIGVTLGVYLVFKYILGLVAPFILAYIFAVLIEKPVRWLHEKWKIKRIVSSTVIMVILVAVLGVAISYLCGKLFSQIRLFISNYDMLSRSVDEKMCTLCENVDSYAGLEAGRSKEMLDNTVASVREKLTDSVVSKAVKGVVPFGIYVLGALGVIVITLIATVLFSSRMENIEKEEKNGLFSKEISYAKSRLFSMLFAYIKAQGVLMIITAIICTVGLYITKNPYGLLLGMLIGLLDALPLFGSGTILVPWTIVQFFKGNYVHAAIIFTTFCLCYIVRQTMEPKLMGGNFGVSSLEMLISIYVGLLLFGILGFMLGPFAYIIIKEICSALLS